MEMPHKGVLVLASICIVAIGISLTYRIKEARIEALNTAAAYTNNIAVEAGTSNQVLAADERVAAALAETQDDLLGTLASSSNPFAPNPKDSISDRFTKNIVAAYSQYEFSKTGDFNLDSASNDTINSIDTSSLPKEKYTLNDLHVYIPKTKDEIKVYGNTFAKTYIGDILPVANDPSTYSSNINAVGNLYRKIAADLMKISVPNELATAHLQIANNFNLMADTFPSIDGQEKDPVKALLGLQVIKTAMTGIPPMFIKINKYFKGNGIIFENTEPGAIWAQVPDTVPAGAPDSTAQN